MSVFGVSGGVVSFGAAVKTVAMLTLVALAKGLGQVEAVSVEGGPKQTFLSSAPIGGMEGPESGVGSEEPSLLSLFKKDIVDMEDFQRVQQRISEIISVRELNGNPMTVREKNRLGSFEFGLIGLSAISSRDANVLQGDFPVDASHSEVKKGSQIYWVDTEKNEIGIVKDEGNPQKTQKDLADTLKKLGGAETLSLVTRVLGDAEKLFSEAVQVNPSLNTPELKDRFFKMLLAPVAVGYQSSCNGATYPCAVIRGNRVLFSNKVKVAKSCDATPAVVESDS